MTKDMENTIISIAKKYKAKRVFLFGSMLDQPETARDIDLGVEGVLGVAFFRMMAEFSLGLPKSVDVIDMDVTNSFTMLVKRDGKVVYEQP